MAEQEVLPGVRIRKVRSDKGKHRAYDEMDEGPVLVVVDGEEIRCTAWSIVGKFLKLSYWPERRGRRGTRFLSIEAIKDLRIEEPDVPSPQPVQTWGTSTGAPTTFTLTNNAAAPTGPQMNINPLIAMRRDPNANPGRIVNRPGDQNPVPMTEVIGENGNREIVEAAILS